MRYSLLLLPILALGLVSCTQIMIEKIPKTEFASQELKPWNAPFQGLWLNPEAEEPKKEKQHSIYIAPVTTQYMTENPKRRWFAREYARASKKLATRFDEQLRKRLAEQKLPEYRVVDSPEQADIIIELAIVKLDRTLVAVNALSLGTSFFVPGVSYALGAISKGDIAMVGRVTNNRNKQLLAVFGDYRTDEPTVFGSIRDYTLYGNHQKAVDMWSKKLAELIAKGKDGKVSPAIWFSLSPF